MRVRVTSRRLSAMVLAATLLTGACRGSGGSAIELDGSPRDADAEGVVTAVSAEKLTLDGKTTYDVADDLQCFSASTLGTIPLAARKGTYVQIGLDGDTVRWVAGFSAVLEFPGRSGVAFHNGVFASADDGKATFEDGSVLDVDDGVELPPKGESVTAEIDVAKKAIVRFSPAASGAGRAAP